jgi:Flp pilus assembly protein TadG
VTAETAVVLPALAVVLALALWAVGAVTAQLRCVDAARVAARAVARGESVESSRQVAREAAPRGSSVSIRRVGDLVTVEVRARAGMPGVLGAGHAGLHVGGRAVATVEDLGAPP